MSQCEDSSLWKKYFTRWNENRANVAGSNKTLLFGLFCSVIHLEAVKKPRRKTKREKERSQQMKCVPSKSRGKAEELKEKSTARSVRNWNSLNVFCIVSHSNIKRTKKNSFFMLFAVHCSEFIFFLLLLLQVEILKWC